MLSDVDTDGMESPCVSHGAARAVRLNTKDFLGVIVLKELET